MVAKVIYLIGSLRNPGVPEVAKKLRDAGYEVFDDWYAAGPEADDKWQQYEKGRDHSFKKALEGFAAEHVYQYDLHHLERADAGVLMLPAGKSGHLELGYMIGRGKPGFILLDMQEPERFDVMYKFAQGVYYTEYGLVDALNQHFSRQGTGTSVGTSRDKTDSTGVRLLTAFAGRPLRDLSASSGQDQTSGGSRPQDGAD